VGKTPEIKVADQKWAAVSAVKKTLSKFLKLGLQKISQCRLGENPLQCRLILLEIVKNGFFQNLSGRYGIWKVVVCTDT
jgi:hypothetical protein